MTIKYIITVILFLTLVNRSNLNSQNQKFKSSEKPFFIAKTIFDPMLDGMGYHNYRIPSFLSTQKGTLLAVMEGREGMNFDHAKNDIVLKRSTDNGKTWSLPRVIREAGDNVVMNPVMVQALDGTIIMTYIYLLR